MTVQERTRKSRIKRRRQVAKQKIALVIASLVVITIGSVGFGSFFSSAKVSKSNVPEYKYYTSIIIEEGDSLWSIANEYNHNTVDIHEYVKELKELKPQIITTSNLEIELENVDNIYIPLKYFTNKKG